MKLTRKFLSIIALLLSLIMLFTSCEIFNNSTTNPPEQEQGGQNETITIPGVNSKGEFDLAYVPEPDYTSSDFDGYVVINNNVPFFTNDEKATDTCFERYSELDSLGRVGVAFSCICKITVPTEGRGDISYKPTGWVQGSYSTSLVPGQYLYNRSHLIAWSLAGENDNAKNLATGTQYMNQRTMQIFENQILNYIKTNNVANDNRVLYRVTPVFNGNNLLCSGVLMEAYSLNDSGEDIQFCVFVYNIQIGIHLDYATGENRLATEFDSPYYGTGSGLAGVKEDVNNGNNEEDPEVIPVPVGKYTISAENSNGTIYFNGSIDDGRFTASTNQHEAVEVTVSTVEGGFVLSFVSGNTVKYIVMNDTAQGAAFTTKASEASVFEWNSSLNTYMVANDANNRAFGTDKSKSYLNLSPYDASSSTNIGKYSWGVFTKIGDAPNPDQGENQNPGGTSPIHKCESECDDCGKCTDKACQEAACAEKCQGHNQTTTGYTKATSVEIGDRIIIVYEPAKAEFNGINSSNVGTYVTYSDNPTGVWVLTLEAGSQEGTFAIKTPDGKYLYTTNENKIKAKTGTVDDSMSWTITFDENGNAIITNVRLTDRVLQWNRNSGQSRFCCYNNTMESVQIYK